MIHNSSQAVTLELIGFSPAALSELGDLLDERGLPWRRPDSEHKDLGEHAPSPVRSDASQGSRDLSGSGATIFVVGDRLSPEESASRLAGLFPRPGEAPRGSVVVLASGGRHELFEPLVAADAIYYLSHSPPPPVDMANLLEGAWRSKSSDGPSAERPGVAIGVEVEELLHDLEQQTKSSTIAGRIAREVELLIEAESAFVWFFDGDQDLLWRPAAWTAREKTRRESAAAGVIGFVSRTGLAVNAPHAGEDPRFEPGADNDHGPKDQRLLAMPVSKGGSSLGVLVALRPANDSPFSAAEEAKLEYLARRLRHVFDLVVERLERDRGQQVMNEQAAEIFRPEALEHYSRGVDSAGRALEISPSWMRRAVWVLVAAALAAIVFAAVGRVEESVAARAVVQLSENEARVVAFLPAKTRPLLEAGMPLRVQLDGFGEIERTTLARVGGILGPEQARAEIGARYAATLEIHGPVIVVEAELRSLFFESGGRRLELHDGLPGQMEVVVDSKTIFKSLMPGSP